jgi:hypothetical protein
MGGLWVIGMCRRITSRRIASQIACRMSHGGIGIDWSDRVSVRFQCNLSFHFLISLI